MKWVLFIGVLGLGFLAPRIMMTKSVGAAHLCYWSYAVLWGALISPMIFYFLAQGAQGQWDIARAFFITSGMFAGMSLLGYTTKKDLSGMGRFLAMATIGLLLAMFANMFIFESTGFHFILSIVVVLVFAGLTAYETQAIKEMYYAGAGAAEGDDADGHLWGIHAVRQLHHDVHLDLEHHRHGARVAIDVREPPGIRRTSGVF